MRLKILKISHDEAVSAFIKGLRHHDTLRSKLLRKWPTTVSELLATAKNYANADDVEKIIKEDVGGPSRPNTHRAVTTTATTVVGTTTTIVMIGAMTTATTETTMISGATAAMTTEASVPTRTIMKSTRLRSQVVTVITRMTTTWP
jgi:hypothetical protein